jgi:DNA-binding GntR family transcriptional regulator
MTAPQEERLEAAILSRLLSNPGVVRTMPELIRELKADRDDVNRALCSLADYGLLEFQGGRAESLRASLAARSCRRLFAATAPRPPH